MNILITGAGGFIGSFMTEKSLASGFNTWAGVRKTTSREFLKDERINFIDLPFSDYDKLKDALLSLRENFKWDVIIHNLGVTKCVDKRDFEKINYEYVKNFTNALIETDMVPRQFILMSSLGALGPGDEKNMTPIKADDYPTPNTAYGKSKLMAENHIKSLNNFPYVIIRPTGVYGPRERDYLLMIKTIIAGFDFGAGYKPQRITFIYVKDLVNCIFRIIEKGVTGKEYIVSEDRDYSSSDFRKYAQRYLNKKCVIPVKFPICILKAVSVIGEEISRISGKPSTLNRDKYNIMKQRNWICDITPLKEDLGFIPSYSLEEGIKESIEWYKENKWI